MITDPCPFCAYVNGEREPHRWQRYNGAFAFDPIGPATDGHRLVVPQRHVPTLAHLDRGELADLWAAVAMDYAFAWPPTAPDMNFVVQQGEVGGQSVEHLHVHLVPRRAGDGLGYRWEPVT